MSSKFISIVENNSLAMSKKWAKVVAESEYTKTYGRLTEDELARMGKRVYDNLGQWMDPKTTQNEIGKIYSDIGARRYEQGYPLCEIHYAVHYTKKVLFNYIFAEGLLPDTLQLYQTHGFIIRVTDFFDLATFYVTRGFQEALYKRITSHKELDKDKITDAFPRGSFYYELEPDFKTFEKAMEGFNLFKVK